MSVPIVCHFLKGFRFVCPLVSDRLSALWHDEACRPRLRFVSEWKFEVVIRKGSSPEPVKGIPGRLCLRMLRSIG